MRSYHSRMFWLISIATLLRIIFSFTNELGNVEVYYWSWSVSLQLNYVDHPPIIAWLIYLTTLGQIFVNEFSIRLVAIASAGICTWLIYALGKSIRDERAGWYAALFYSTCIYTSIGVGLYVLPDSPQLIFWLTSLFIMLKIMSISAQNQNVTKYWLLLGLTSGLCIMCKVHGVAVWFGIFIYCLMYDRRQFRRINIYLAMLITLVIISPFIVWNFQHDWYTWKFQSSRFTVMNNRIDLRRFLKQLAGVIFAFGPFHIFMIWQSIIIFFRRRTSIMEKRKTTMVMLFSLPMILFLLSVSIFREIYFHWPGPGYAVLLIMPALNLSARYSDTQFNHPKILIWCAGYCLTILILQSAFTNYYPGTTSVEKKGIYTGTGDVTADMVGWKETGRLYHQQYDQLLRNKAIKPSVPILITSWTPGSAVDFYLARKSGQPILGLGGIDSLHQYYLKNSGGSTLKRNENAIYVVPSNHLQLKTVQTITRHFDSATNILTVPTYRSGLLCKEVYIFLLKKYDGQPFIFH